MPFALSLPFSIHNWAPDDKKLFSQIGLSFALIYAIVISVDYFLQLAVVQPSILSGETADYLCSPSITPMVFSSSSKLPDTL
jgi:hypothetical protein